MFNLFKKASTQPPASSDHPLRATLFGDQPLDTWGATGNGEPWTSFATALRLRESDPAGAREALSAVLGRPSLESRHYVQAWDALRAFGAVPAGDQAKHVYGVVVDVPMSKGSDTLAAYEDGSARYLNFSGAAIIWEHPDRSLQGEIDGLLAAGRALVARIGPWEHARPPLPPGLVRISVFTPSGLHFGQGPRDAFFKDPLAAPVLNAAGVLMQALIAKRDERRGK